MKDLFVNAQTGEMTEIETTKESIAEMKALQESQAMESQTKAAQRAELLSRLGITEQEANLLLGA